MGVKPNEFHLHDWDQYESRQPSVSGTKNDPIVVSTRTTYDLVSKDNEQRKQIIIDNVWIEVGYNNPEEDGRAEVMFRFSLQMRESAWEGKGEPRPGDLYWRCERISTEPIH